MDQSETGSSVGEGRKAVPRSWQRRILETTNGVVLGETPEKKHVWSLCQEVRSHDVRESRYVFTQDIISGTVEVICSHEIRGRGHDGNPSQSMSIRRLTVKNNQRRGRGNTTEAKNSHVVRETSRPLILKHRRKQSSK